MKIFHKSNQNIISLKKILGLMLISIFANITFAQTTVVFTSSGSWVCPAGVTSVAVTCIGGGGGGGGGGTNGLSPAGAGGGAGGAYAYNPNIVVAAGTYTVTVGTGGAGGNGQNDGVKGNDSWFSTVGTIFARGGNGGGQINATTALGGSGTIVGSIGTVRVAGGNGANGTDANGGGGGGGGPSTTGVPGVGAVNRPGGAGGAPDGGTGGTGAPTSEGNGTNATAYGGGGGGAFCDDNSDHDGGNGGNGVVILTFTCGPSTKTFNVAAGNWNVAGNWTPAGVPGVCDNVVIPNARTCTNTAAAVCNNLTIQSGGNLITNSAVTVGGTFTIDNGGTYTHNNATDPGTTIFAGGESFGVSSNMVINDWISPNTPLGQYAGQFGNITFNAAQGVWDQDGTFSPDKIKGNVNVTDDQINFDDGTGGTTILTIGGDVTTSAGGTILFQGGADRNLTLTTGSVTHNGAFVMTVMDDAIGNLVWNINGDFNVSNDFTALESSSLKVGSCTVNCTGSMSITGGLFDFNRQVNGNVDLNFTGNIVNNTTGWVYYLDAASRGNLTVDCNNFSVLTGGTNTFFAGTLGSSTFTIAGDVITSGATTCNFNSSPSTGNNIVNVGGNFTNSSTGWIYFSNLATFTGLTDINITGNLTTSGTRMANFTNGQVDWGVGGNLTMSGTAMYGQRVTTNANSVNFVIGGNYNQTAGDVIIQRGTGVMNFTTTGSMSMSGTTFSGSDNAGNIALFTYDIGTDLNMTSGTYYGTEGYGSVNFTTGGVFNQDAGIFYGVNHNVVGEENAVTTFNLNSVDFDGGDCIIHNNVITNGSTCLLNVTNDFDVNFTAGTDNFICLNIVGGGINAVHDFNVGGNFIVSGNNAAYFITSGTLGNETVDIVGNVTVSGGLSWFNGNETAGLGHNNVFNIGGNVAVSGGLLLFSGQGGTNDVNVTGNFTVSGGEVIVKDEDGASTLDIGGNFSQTSGTMYSHKDAADATADVVAVTVNGTFSHTGGIYDFDPNTSSTATHTLTLNGSSIILGPGGFIQHASPETGTVFGEIYVNPSSGTTTYNRVSNVHRILQTKIILNAGKVMNATSSVSNIQIAANNAADDVIPATTIMLDIFGNLILGDTRVFGRSSSASFSPTSIIVESGGEIQLTRAQGMYDGSNNASIMSRSFNAANSANTINSTNWFLAPNSRITYNGSANQVVTGKFPANLTTATTSDVVLATNAGYHYYDLEIDHQGTVGTNFVYPAASNVFVRNMLDMDRGEFRLDGSGTGYMINIENPATTGITLTGTGGVETYIRSETNLGTNPSIVRWYMGTTVGNHVIPFGHSAGASNYVPFTFNVNSGGGAGSFVDVSTRATDDGTVANNRDNNPRETSVTNMYSPTISGDGATEAVIDRWWQIDVSTAYNADITFTYRGVENTLDAPYNLANVGAQRWDGAEWQPDNANWGSTPSVLTGTGSVTVTGVTAFSPWVLSSVDSPLPAELTTFKGRVKPEFNKLDWVSSTEINLSHYVIESSVDAVHFEKIGELAAVGNSSTSINYEYEDTKYFSPITYYRLVMVDYDGSEELSNVIMLKRENETSNWSASLYPNPSNGELVLNIDLLEADVAQVRVLSLLGQVIYNEKIDCRKGLNTSNLNFSNLSNGIYHVEISTGGLKKTLQFVKN